MSTATPSTETGHHGHEPFLQHHFRDMRQQFRGEGLGYSTVAETYHAGLPFGYVLRSHFRESAVLQRFIESEMPGAEVPEAEGVNLLKVALPFAVLMGLALIVTARPEELSVYQVFDPIQDEWQIPERVHELGVAPIFPRREEIRGARNDDPLTTMTMDKTILRFLVAALAAGGQEFQLRLGREGAEHERAVLLADESGARRARGGRRRRRSAGRRRSRSRIQG